MAGVELVRFSGGEALARTVADRWLEFLQASDEEGRSLFVGLSGGRIAATFFSEVTQLARDRSWKMPGVHFFWADERCVGPEDIESNYRLAAVQMLEPLKVPPVQIHRIQGERVPAAAAAAAEVELRHWVPPGTGGYPELDLVLLGMGEDGHVASIFPDGPAQAFEGDSLYLAVVATKPPPNRITMSLKVLAAARQVWVLAAGPGKEAALRRSLESGGRTPLAELLRRRATTWIFTEIGI